MAHSEILAFRGLLSSSSTNTEGSSDDSTTNMVTANSQPDPPYLYYRLFTKSIAVPSEHPTFRENKYLGRVRADSIAPPQTVLLIKQRLCNIEGIRDSLIGSTLFASRASKLPMKNAERVCILTPGSPGSNPEEPMELVIDIPEDHSRFRLSASTHPKPQYIYYKLYAEDGEISSKHPIHPDADQSRSLARIDANLVPPPYTLYAVMQCISFFEGFSYNCFYKMFNDITAEFPFDNNASIPSSNGPGSTPDRPLAFVKPVEMTQHIKARYEECSPLAGFLSYKKQELLFTDGLIRQEFRALPWRPFKPESSDSKFISVPPVTHLYIVYRARNAAGEHGFVKRDDMELD